MVVKNFFYIIVLIIQCLFSYIRVLLLIGNHYTRGRSFFSFVLLESDCGWQGGVTCIIIRCAFNF